MPHDVLDSLLDVSHVPAAVQQPLGHEPPPHVQAPAVHDSPDAHAAHATPPVPQAAPDCDEVGTHVLPLQQPVAHEVASQTHRPAVLHSWPVAHVAHAAPAVPHDALDCDPKGTHAPVAEQQPLGQVFASHPHDPFVRSHV